MHQYTYIRTFQEKMKLQNYLTIVVLKKKSSTTSIELAVCWAVSEVASETCESLSSWNQNY